MDVIVHVDPGPRVHLSKVELQNNTEYSDAELLKLFKLKPGAATDNRARAVCRKPNPQIPGEEGPLERPRVAAARRI